jgi:hypothetical protein
VPGFEGALRDDDGRGRGDRRVGPVAFADNSPNSTSEAVVSYNGDHVIHFKHPTWRSNRNDPTTATRVDGRRRS